MSEPRDHVAQQTFLAQQCKSSSCLALSSLYPRDLVRPQSSVSQPVSEMAGALLRGLAWPLLLLLHLAFSVFSLLLRITESFSHPEPTSRTSASVSPTVPHHVALCLPSRKSGTRRRNGTRENEQERKALVETLKRAVRWSIQDGVRELSVYSNIGKCHLRFLPRSKDSG